MINKKKIFLCLSIITLLISFHFSCNTKTEKTEEILIPPSSQELSNNNFAFPEIARILCEQLKKMGDSGDDFTLIDTRLNADFKRGFIPGAINIPNNDLSPFFTQEWVSNQLKALPGNETIIFYCD
jgi:3-mercaptopyruvate sulfurtransferase SseA